MRKLIFSGLTALLFFALFSNKSHAQITGINNVGGEVYAPNVCFTPAQLWVSFGFTAQGTAMLTDVYTVHLNFDDGSDTTFTMAACNSYDTLAFDSLNFYLLHTYSLPGTYTASGTVTAPPPSAVSVPLSFNTITITNACSNITGRLYLDANNNCIADAGEQPIPYVFAEATSTTTGVSYSSWNASDGTYSIQVPDGDTYTMSTYNGLSGLTLACTPSPVTVAGTATYTADFGLICPAASSLDFSAYAYAWNFRPGYERPLYIGTQNYDFCQATGGTVTVTLSPKLSYAGNYYFNPPTGVAGNTLTWNVPAIDPWNTFFSSVMIYCNTSAQVGDTANVTVIITPPAGITDANPANNTYTIPVGINDSFDPNEKGVAPAGITDQGLIPTTTQELTYLVDFQNTGNDTAYNVSITDPIDAALDPASIHIIKAGAPVQAALVNGNTMKFRFNGINLPDSTTNEHASHGYILYTAKLKPGAVAGTVIHNTANIYFDYNDAIVTNTTVNTLQNPTGIQQLTAGTVKATVFPNPADATVNVTLNDNTAANVTLMDMAGRTIQQLPVTNGSAAISTKALAEGLYQVSIRSGAQVLSTKVLVKH